MIPGKYHGYPPGITRENGFFFFFFFFFAEIFCTVMPFGGGGGVGVSLNKWPLALAFVYFLE